MTRGNVAWTEEEVATLRSMWAEGATASRIAKAITTHTRNSIIGKAHRLKLDARKSPVVRKPPPPPARHPCRWPIGDPKMPDFRFCGAEAKADGDDFKPYCEEHCRLAYARKGGADDPLAQPITANRKNRFAAS